MPAGRPFSEAAVAIFISSFADLLTTHPKIVQSRTTSKLVSSFIGSLEPPLLREYLTDMNPASLDECYTYLLRQSKDGGVGLVDMFVTIAIHNQNTSKSTAKPVATDVDVPTPDTTKSRWKRQDERREGLRAAAATTTAIVKFPP